MSSYGNANQYNTRRTSSRYNTTGQFVPASPAAPSPGPGPGPAVSAASLSNMRLTTQINNLHTIQTTDIEMKPEPPATPAPPVPSAAGADAGPGAGPKDDAPRPAWMKPRLAGVKKISNKMRRRRQNATLRRLLTPKNALMVLNEMLPAQQLASQYTVEACSPYSAPNLYGKPAAFAAQLAVHGHTYTGYGDTKMAARNAAAEQAIRDLVLQRMEADRAREAADGANGGLRQIADAARDGDGDGDGDGEGDGEEGLPMMQIASFALHKLFSEWEYDGHRVPQLKPPKISESGSAAGDAAPEPPRAARGPRAPRGPRPLPANAGSLHPAMLLAYMRPVTAYHDLEQAGDKPQNTVFTIGVDVDGHTYCGKGVNKKEARRAAARAACEALFGVVFEETAQETKPVPGPAAEPAAAEA